MSSGGLLLKIVHKRLSESFAKYIVPGSKLLDIGCGTKPLAKLLAPYNIEYIGLDHPDTLHGTESIDIMSTAYEIPIPDNHFQHVTCTAVLEHLEEPEMAIREAHRVLKPGGTAFYSIPFFWHLHEEPRDFYRFTKYGIRYLFEKSGFEIVELLPLSGYWLMAGQMKVYYLRRFRRGPLKWLGIIDFICFLITRITYLFDKMDHPEHWTWMYLVVARKKEASA